MYIPVMTSVGIIEDDDEIRTAIREFLQRQKDCACEIGLPSVESFLYTVPLDGCPDVLLLDIGLPGMSGITGIPFLRQRYPEMDIVMLTVHDDPERIFQALCAGATGYLLKNTPFRQIMEGIKLLQTGGAPMSPEIAAKVVAFFHPHQPKRAISPLTEKEREVVAGLVDGLSYKLIADRMHISVQTVQVHIKNVYRKVHAHNKAEIVAKSLRGEL
ncbi:MAG TPA: response regulator transcription factor [Bacteroidota bacterium]|nr:response regulator transcription factor [Bacteroidota bacterium]